MAKQKKTLYYSYSPVTQELMITTVDPDKLGEVENVMLDTDHYLQVDPQTKKTKGFFILFVDPENEDEAFHSFPNITDIQMLGMNDLFPTLK